MSTSQSIVPMWRVGTCNANQNLYSAWHTCEVCIIPPFGFKATVAIPDGIVRT